MADFFSGTISGDAAFAAAIGFLAGILAVSFGWSVPVVAGIFAGSGFLAFAAFRNGKFLAYGFISFAAVFLGAYYFCLFIGLRSAGERLPSGAASPFQAMVSERPIESEKYISFPAELRLPYAGKVTVFAPLGSDIRYGDLLGISGALEPPMSKGDLPAVFPKRINVVSRGNGFWLTERLLDITSAVSEKFGAFLSRDEAALLSGMTFGGTNAMSAALKSEMAASETLYVASMYGYKIAVVIGVMESLLAGFVPRRMRFCGEVLVATFFVVISGGNISALRGGIMACLVLLAKATGSLFSKRNAFAFAAAGMAISDPTVVAQAGFLFSFASVAGMSLLTEPVGRFFRLGTEKGIFGWKQAVTVSVASLLPVIPLVSVMFGSFSLTAIFANILIAPAIPIGMAAGAALALSGFISPHVAFFVARGAGMIIDYTLAVVHFFAAHAVPLPFSFSGILPFMLYYAAIGFFAYAYREHGIS